MKKSEYKVWYRKALLEDSLNRSTGRVQSIGQVNIFSPVAELAFLKRSSIHKFRNEVTVCRRSKTAITTFEEPSTKINEPQKLQQNQEKLLLNNLSTINRSVDVTAKLPELEKKEIENTLHSSRSNKFSRLQMEEINKPIQINYEDNAVQENNTEDQKFDFLTKIHTEDELIPPVKTSLLKKTCVGALLTANLFLFAGQVYCMSAMEARYATLEKSLMRFRQEVLSNFQRQDEDIAEIALPESKSKEKNKDSDTGRTEIVRRAKSIIPFANKTIKHSNQNTKLQLASSVYVGNEKLLLPETAQTFVQKPNYNKVELEQKPETTIKTTIDSKANLFAPIHNETTPNNSNEYPIVSSSSAGIYSQEKVSVVQPSADINTIKKIQQPSKAKNLLNKIKGVYSYNELLEDSSSLYKERQSI